MMIWRVWKFVEGVKIILRDRRKLNDEAARAHEDALKAWKEAKMTARLDARKAIRKVESERVRQGKLAAQRERWANDPLRVAQ